MGRFLSAAGCTSVTSDGIWVESVVYVLPYPFSSQNIFTLTSMELSWKTHWSSGSYICIFQFPKETLGLPQLPERLCFILKD